MSSPAGLPLCARLALWGTAAYAGRLRPDEALARTCRGYDAVGGDLSRLELWRDLGEQVLLLALPRPGDVTSVPRGNPDLVDAAARAGECVYVPGVGGALVPSVGTFGPEGDEGTALTWTAYDCDPWPRHRLEQLSVGEAELRLRQELAEGTDELHAIDGAAYPLGARGSADRRLHGHGPAADGLPPGLPQRAHRTIVLAAQVRAIAAVGRSPLGDTVDSASTGARLLVLGRLQAAADRALETAVNVAATTLTGWR